LRPFSRLLSVSRARDEPLCILYTVSFLPDPGHPCKPRDPRRGAGASGLDQVRDNGSLVCRHSSASLRKGRPTWDSRAALECLRRAPNIDVGRLCPARSTRGRMTTSVGAPGNAGRRLGPGSRLRQWKPRLPAFLRFAAEGRPTWDSRAALECLRRAPNIDVGRLCPARSTGGRMTTSVGAPGNAGRRLGPGSRLRQWKPRLPAFLRFTAEGRPTWDSRAALECLRRAPNIDVGRLWTRGRMTTSAGAPGNAGRRVGPRPHLWQSKRRLRAFLRFAAERPAYVTASRRRVLRGGGASARGLGRSRTDPCNTAHAWSRPPPRARGAGDRRHRRR